MEETINDSSNTISVGLGSITNNTYDYGKKILLNPVVLFILVATVIVYIVLFVFLGQKQDNISGNMAINSGSKVLFMVFIVVFIGLLVINGLKYIFKIDIIAKLSNIFSDKPELDILVDTSKLQAIKKPPVPEIMLRQQVFNIPENRYSYLDAKALCKAYDARLATYSEVEESYKAGGEWCNYGWSDNQLALFPTQQKTYDELQKIEGHENDCGRPGVNGGYIANPNVKFGVNCYGYKPRITKEEEELMATQPLYPKTMKDIAMENRVKYWKDKLTDVLVSPFNHKMWSRL